MALFGFALFLVQFSILPGHANPSAQHLFPLAKTSITYDFVLKAEQKNALPGECPLLAESSEYDFNSFFYDGSPKSIGHFSLTEPAESRFLNKFTFAFTISPRRLQGVLFEYRADNESSSQQGDITRVKVELLKSPKESNKGTARMTLHNLTQEIAEITASEYELEAGKWKKLTVTASMLQNESINMKIFIKHDKITSETEPVQGVRGLAYPGHLNLGGSWTNDSHYIGNINCAAFYDDFFDDKEDVEAYEDECKEFKDAEPTDVPDCPIDASPIHMWPLTDKSLAYDIMTMTYCLKPAYTDRCPDLDDIEIEKDKYYPSWILDGSENKQIQMNVSDDLYSFTLALHIYPDSLDGVLLEYKAYNPENASIAQFIISLTPEGYLRVQFNDLNGDVLLDKRHKEKYSLHNFEMMIVAWNPETGKLFLRIKDQDFPIDTDKAGRRLSTPGKLTVGGASSVHWPDTSLKPFHGKVSCLAIYDQDISDKEKYEEKYPESCKHENWPNFPAVPTCRANYPIHLWPLTEATSTCDIVTRGNGGTPTDSSSLQFADFGENTFRYKSLQVDSMPTQVILDIPANTLYHSFTFGAFVSADVGDETVTGTLMEYKMDPSANISGNVFTQVTVEFANCPDCQGKLTVSMKDKEETITWTIPKSDDKLDDSSKPFLVSWDFEYGLQVTVKDKDTGPDKPNDFAKLPLGVPGKLYIGGEQTSAFKGKISCVMFFSRSFGQQPHDEREELKTLCENLQLPDKEYFDTSTCSNKTIPTTSEAVSIPATPETLSTIATSEAVSTTLLTPTTVDEGKHVPSHLWPLNNHTQDHDVMMSMTPPPSPPDVTSCFRVDDSDPFPPIKLDGSLVSNLTLPVSESAFAGDFSLVLFAKVEQPAEGVLLDYTASENTTEGITKIQISTAPNNSLRVSVRATDGSDLCSERLIPGVFEGESAWTMLHLQRNATSGIVKIIVNGSDVGGLKTCSTPGNDLPGKSGSLRIGGRSGDDESAGFRGSLKCLMIFSDVVMGTGDTTFLQTCEDRSTNASLAELTCSNKQNIRVKGYRRIRKNVQPDIPSHPPIKSVDTSSAVVCAEKCLQTTFCRSFVVTVNATSHVQCQLFDYVTKQRLLPSDGSNYYEIKN